MRSIRPVRLTLLCFSSSILLLLFSQASVFDGPGGLALIFPWLVVLGLHLLVGPVALYTDWKQGLTWARPFIYFYFIIFAGVHFWLFIHGSGLDKEAQNAWRRHSNPLEAELHTTLRELEMQRARNDAPDPGAAAVAVQFVRRGADTNYRGLNTRPFLVRACALGLDELALVMLQHGADANGADSSGVTPIHAAAAQCSPDVVTELLRRRAAIDTRDAWKNTPLLLAVRAGRIDNADVLLKHGAAVDAPDQSGQTPLIEAIAHNDAPMVQALLLGGADANGHNLQGRSVLTLAAGGTNPETVRILLAHGSVLNTPGHGTDLPLREVLRKGRLDDAEALLRIGANVNATTAGGDALLAEVAGFSVRFGSGSAGKHEIMDWLLRNGANPEGPDRKGRTPLELTSGMQDDDGSRLLRAAGAQR